MKRSPPARRRNPLPLPWSITVTDDGKPVAFPSEPYRALLAPASADFTIVRRWLTLASVAAAALSIFWFWVSWYFASGQWVISVLQFGVGLMMGYAALAGVVNRTTLTVRGGALFIRHHPIPWPGNRSLATKDLAQISCKELRRRAVVYSVVCDLKSGERVELLTGLPDATQARFIEQTLESRLGIEDAPAAGELPVA